MLIDIDTKEDDPLQKAIQAFKMALQSHERVTVIFPHRISTHAPSQAIKGFSHLITVFQSGDLEHLCANHGIDWRIIDQYKADPYPIVTQSIVNYAVSHNSPSSLDTFMYDPYSHISAFAREALYISQNNAIETIERQLDTESVTLLQRIESRGIIGAYRHLLRAQYQWYNDNRDRIVGGNPGAGAISPLGTFGRYIRYILDTDYKGMILYSPSWKGIVQDMKIKYHIDIYCKDINKHPCRKDNTYQEIGYEDIVHRRYV